MYVLIDDKPQAVARNLIENGNQVQPFYIFDMNEAYRRILHFRQMMPRVKIFYAMRANDTPMMLRLAISQGLGFDCASPTEIYKLRTLKVSPRNIICTSPIKTPEHMKYAKTTGLTHTVFDSSNELRNLKKYWSDARLLLRIRVSIVNKASDFKFGCDFDTEAIELLEEAASLGLKVVGINFHVDGTANSYEKGLKYAKTLFEHETKAGRQMKIVNIGGGFPSNETNDIDEISNLINPVLEDLFPDPNIQIIAEPGKYICASAFTLYCNISNVRKVESHDKIAYMLYIMDGVYGTMRYCDRSVIISKFKEREINDLSRLEETILWGPSGDSLDRVLLDRDVRLPQCYPQDWLVFSGNGAYSMSYATKFSSISLPLVQPVISMDLWKKISKSKVFLEQKLGRIKEKDANLFFSLLPALPQSTDCHHPNIPTLQT